MEEHKENKPKLLSHAMKNQTVNYIIKNLPCLNEIHAGGGQQRKYPLPPPLNLIFFIK